MAATALSVVIPTRNRMDVLAATLDALDRQEGLSQPLQIVVADDGSTDGTRDRLASRTAGPHRIQTIAGEHRGPAAARNRAIRCCEGDRVLLLGDDTIPTPGCVAAHLEMAAGRDIGVQGMIDWDPSVGITRLMRFMAPAGPQFFFKGLGHGDTIPWTRMAGSNLSAPRAWFEAEPFDEGIPEVALEDGELAYRWSRRGWRGVFSLKARCLHRHRYSEPAALMDRQRRAGRAAKYVIRRHPELVWQLAGRVVLFGLAVGLRGFIRRITGRNLLEDRWDVRGRIAYLRGLVGGPA